MKIDLRVFSLKEYVNLTQDEADEAGIYGLFRLKVGEKEYGFYEEDRGVDEKLRGYEHSISMWIELLLDAVITLKIKNYCAIRDIERMGVWLEFNRTNDDEIMLSMVEDKSSLGGPHLITQQLQMAVITEWGSAKVKMNDLISEVISAANEYLRQIDEINPVFSKTPETQEIKKTLAIAIEGRSGRSGCP